MNNNVYPFAMGNYHRPISCKHNTAQVWFDRGLIWTYGFNHDEAARCFEKAIEADESCAMAYWGLAYVKGPFLNKTWDLFSNQEREVSLAYCYDLSQRALGLSTGSTGVEKAIINALSKRYGCKEAHDLEILYACNDAYADAMRQAHKAFPEDLDIMALFAEAMMLRTPWRLWDIKTGEPVENTNTLEIIEVLEKGLALTETRASEDHLGILHMYIHAIEMSPYPERGLQVADKLRELAPDVGHLLHMPSHIDVLCGNYSDAVEAGIRSTRADAKYLKQVGPHDFYATACCHDYHLMMFAAMFLGHYRCALAAAEGLKQIVTEDVLKKAATPYLYLTLENYHCMIWHVYVRFGKWDEIIALAPPENPELYSLTNAMYYYALGVAHSAKGNIQEAETVLVQFEKAAHAIPADRHLFNNTAQDALKIARAMFLGELEYRKAHYKLAFEHLREAVQLNDDLAYTEPWAWMHPPRHALAALLLEQNHVEEAEAVCRADLGLSEEISRACWHPNNVWMLHAYLECLERLGKHEQMPPIQLQLKLAQARTDIPIKSSCCCRKDTHSSGCC